MTRRPSTKTAAKELGERLRREGEELHLTQQNTMISMTPST